MFLSHQSQKPIPKSWILLDSQSTIDIFCSPSQIENIRKIGEKMKIHCNVGTHVTDLIGDLPGYGTVWFDPQAIANVLSLQLVKKKYHISYDSNDKNGFIVTKPDRTTFEFRELKSGLHYLDTSKQIEAKKEETELYKNDGHHFVINTVAHNCTQYTNNDYLHPI